MTNSHQTCLVSKLSWDGKINSILPDFCDSSDSEWLSLYIGTQDTHTQTHRHYICNKNGKGTFLTCLTKRLWGLNNVHDHRNDKVVKLLLFEMCLYTEVSTRTLKLFCWIPWTMLNTKNLFKCIIFLERQDLFSKVSRDHTRVYTLVL